MPVKRIPAGLPASGFKDFMKACPQCGFQGTVSNKRMLALLNRHFPGLPVMEMIKREWLHPQTYSKWLDRAEWCSDEVPDLLAEIQYELIKFFDVASVEKLKELCGWVGDLMDEETEEHIKC